MYYLCQLSLVSLLWPLRTSEAVLSADEVVTIVYCVCENVRASTYDTTVVLYYNTCTCNPVPATQY
jgi:hypothetical protein